MKKHITLKTIAIEAGVSTAAVSMILGNKSTERFPKATIEKVFSIANAYGYKPPRALKDKKKILIICPFLINPYYAILVQSVEQKAFEYDCITTVFTTYWRLEREKEACSLIKQHLYDGVIFTMVPMQSEYAITISKLVPTVIVGDRKYDSGLDAVDVDNVYAGKLVAEHLISLGHKHIAYISTEMTGSHSARLLRYEGLKNEYDKISPESGVTVFTQTTAGEEQNGLSDLEYQIGFTMAQKCIAENPLITALVGINDMVSYGIVDGLTASGKKIPEEYSVCSFDNVYPSHFSTISLTTVDYCIEERGRKAAQLVIDKLKKTAALNSITRIEYKISLKIRNSSGKVRKS